MAEPSADYRVRSAFTELTLARIRELTREPEAIFWVFVFPIILAAILGLAFRSRPVDRLPVAVVAGPHAEARMAILSRGLELEPRVLPEADARQALARGHVVLVVSGGDSPAYSYDPTQPESRAARLIVDGACAHPLTLDFELNDPNDPEQVYTRSDHFSYAAKGIPVAFFTTGLHRDYHQVSDTVDKILFPKLARIAQLVYETGFSVANSERRLERDNKGPRTGYGSKAEVIGR